MRNKLFLALIFPALLIASSSFAESTEFTYQGRLLDGSLAPTANYDFEFRLYPGPGGGVPILGTQQRLGIAVASGIFTVKLDFGTNFDGTERWLEILVKPAGSPNPFVLLNPRQPITSAPYSIRSLNSTTADTSTNSLQLGGVEASQYVITTDSRMADARTPLPGSPSYVQNTNVQQASSNFNISGTGTADILNVATSFNIGNLRFLRASAANSNVFAGFNSGTTNTTGTNNHFFGINAGASNTTGGQNSFFGGGAGANNNGSNNSFFGTIAGNLNQTGGNNSFFGALAGTNSSSGSANTFIGAFTGVANFTGSNNTLVGSNSDVAANNLTFATAIGAGAVASASNRIVLGRDNAADNVLIWGKLLLNTLGASGNINLCITVFTAEIAACSSSIRYKTNIQTFSGGLNIARRLRPITFDWKQGGTRDIGFLAEDVELVEPLLATYDNDGRIEGVKYGQISAVLVNAVNEQQQIIERQQKQIDDLKKLVCLSHPTADVCKVHELKQ